MLVLVPAVASAMDDAPASTSPAVDTVTLSGTGTTPDSAVGIFFGSQCTGDVANSVDSGDDGSWSATTRVAHPAATPFYALTTDSMSVQSCTEVTDQTPPAAPDSLATDPPAEGSSSSPTLSGTAEPGATVQVFKAAACPTDPPTPADAQAFADADGNWSVPVDVTPGEPTTFYATATDAANNTSPCSTGLEYTQRNDPAASPPPASNPSSPLVPVPSSGAPVRRDPGPSSQAQKPTPDVKLSNETTTTRWAHTRRSYIVRAAPRSTARHVARLHYWNEDGASEIYMVLRSRFDSAGRKWVQIRLPMRPNGTTGWVPRGGLLGFHVVHTQLIIDKHTLRGTLYRNGRRIWRAPVGVGKHSTPTPSGHFWIREKLRSLSANTIYGPLAFGTSAYSVLSDWPGGGVVGVHGTDQPRLIPGRPSHGCVRVRNAAIVRLGRLMPLGTPVRIR